MSVTELFETKNVVDDAELQFTSDGRLRHLLTLRGLSRQQMTGLLDRAEAFLSPAGQPAVRAQAL